MTAFIIIKGHGLALLSIRNHQQITHFSTSICTKNTAIWNIQYAGIASAYQCQSWRCLAAVTWRLGSTTELLHQTSMRVDASWSCALTSPKQHHYDQQESLATRSGLQSQSTTTSSNTFIAKSVWPAHQQISQPTRIVKSKSVWPGDQQIWLTDVSRQRQLTKRVVWIDVGVGYIPAADCAIHTSTVTALACWTHC